MPTVMADEIAQQPEAVERTVGALLPLREELRALSAPCRSVLFVARGSSDNAAMYGRYLLETHSGRLASLAAPSVATHYRSALDLRDVLVVAISQSGETEEIVATLHWARSRGARTVAVTNHADSALATAADLVLATQAGAERAVPATKTYTTQLVAMAVLGAALAPAPHALDAALARVPDEIARLISERTGVDEAVELLASCEQLLVTGRGLMLGTALELALKVEETCLRPVRAMSYADLRHGPIAMVSGGVGGVLVSAGDGPMVTAVSELARELSERGMKAAVAVGGDDRLAELCDVAVAGPRLVEAVAPLAAAVPVQLLAEGLARHLGLDPDNPKGLRKVTQTDRER